MPCSNDAVAAGAQIGSFQQEESEASQNNWTIDLLSLV